MTIEYYYVNKNTTNQGRHHEVHKTGCKYMPNAINRVELGLHGSCTNALAAARAKGFSNVDGCYFCINACHTG